MITCRSRRTWVCSPQLTASRETLAGAVLVFPSMLLEWDKNEAVRKRTWVEGLSLRRKLSQGFFFDIEIFLELHFVAHPWWKDVQARQVKDGVQWQAWDKHRCLHWSLIFFFLKRKQINVGKRRGAKVSKHHLMLEGSTLDSLPFANCPRPPTGEHQNLSAHYHLTWKNQITSPLLQAPRERTSRAHRVCLTWHVSALFCRLWTWGEGT